MRENKETDVGPSSPSLLPLPSQVGSLRTLSGRRGTRLQNGTKFSREPCRGRIFGAFLRKEYGQDEPPIHLVAPFFRCGVEGLDAALFFLLQGL